MPDIDTVRGGVGVDPDDELDNLCQHGRPGTADEQDKAKVTNVGQNRSAPPSWLLRPLRSSRPR